jgi:hypothetical protein
VLITPPAELGAPVYRIFSGWDLPEEWRLSSGTHDLDNLKSFSSYFLWRQSSGTVYQLSKNKQPNFTEYVQSVLTSKVLVPAKRSGFDIQFLSVADLDNALKKPAKQQACILGPQQG